MGTKSAGSFVITQSFTSFFTGSSQVRFGLSQPLLILKTCFNRLLCTDASEGLCWICPNHLNVGQASLQLVPSQLSHIYHHSGSDPFLYDHMPISTCASLPDLGFVCLFVCAFAFAFTSFSF